jgi:hypothetical protein
MGSLDSCMPKQRPFLVIRPNKLNRRIIVWPAIPPSINELAIILRHDSEILIPFIDTHHIFHRVCVRSSQCPISVPVRNYTNIQNVIHKSWKFDIFFKNTRWVFKRIIIMVGAVFFSKLFKEIFKG